MPSDANGVYTLPDGYLAVTGETILASQHNPPLEDLASSMTLRMMRSGTTPMTGALKLSDGTVSAPSATFNTATTTGWYKTSSGIGFAVGGVKVAELVAGGFKTGARYIGELIPYSGVTAPALTVMPYGQTLDRTTYADLWAFAQTQIAAGNTFYNNGNGTTTFGIGDLRGRVVAGADSMGGVAAGRLTDLVAGIDAVGDAGGAQSHTLTAGQLPANIPNSATTTLTPAAPVVATNVNGSLLSAGGTNVPINTTTLFASTTVTINPSGGAAHNNVQPTMVCNYLLFVGA